MLLALVPLLLAGSASTTERCKDAADSRSTAFGVERCKAAAGSGSTAVGVERCKGAAGSAVR